MRWLTGHVSDSARVTSATPVRALFLNGTVGVGKSTTADAVAEALQARSIRHAVIDLDALRNGWPAPAGDRFNTTIELANLRSVAANFVAAGAQVLVLAGVLEDAAMLNHYRDALGDAALTVVRLSVSPEEGQRRLARRHDNDPTGLAWHRNRFGELDAVLDAAGIPGPRVDTTGVAPADVARTVLTLVGF